MTGGTNRIAEPRAQHGGGGPLGDPGSVPFPHRLLADDEDVLRHLHPHWLTLAGPVLRLLLVIGATSFAAALVPAGRHQGVLRLLVLALAVLLLLISVGGPLLR